MDRKCEECRWSFGWKETQTGKLSWTCHNTHPSTHMDDPRDRDNSACGAEGRYFEPREDEGDQQETR